MMDKEQSAKLHLSNTRQMKRNENIIERKETLFN